MRFPLAACASSLLFAVALAAGGGSSGGTFDGGNGGFDSSSPSEDAVAPGDDGGGSLDGGDGGDGAVTPPPPTPNDVYVDQVAGLDTNTGKSGSPFKTLTKALSVVPGGAGVHLLDGTYDGANEGNGIITVTIPADVNVRSENPGKASISLIVHTTGGNTALYDLTIMPGTEIDAIGTTNLLGSNLQFLPNSYFSMLVVKDSAQATLVGGVLDGKGGATPVSGGGVLDVQGTGTLTLDGFAMKDLVTTAIRLDGPALATKAKLVIKNDFVSDNVYNTLFAGNNASVTIDHATFKNSAAAALTVAEGIDLTITNSTFTGNNIAVSAAQGFVTTDNSFLKVATSTFTSNLRGVLWQAPGHLDVSVSTFTGTPDPNGGTTTGLYLFAGAPTFTAIVRTTTIHGYDVGVDAISQGATTTIDLGTGASPGNNDFSQCVRYGVYDELPAGTSLDAQGNKWNPSLQGSDATGKYTAGTTFTGPTTGGNYSIFNASTINL